MKAGARERKSKAQEQRAVEFRPPMKPRRGVFILLCAVFGVWVGVLLALYVTTVRSHSRRAATQVSVVTPRPAGLGY
jgi:hypothetical protein